MRRILVLGAMLAAMLATPAVASANTTHVGPCPLNADNPSYSGTTVIFQGGVEDYCNNVGGSFPMAVQVCSQENWGAGWFNMNCPYAPKQTVPTTYFRWGQYASCHVWYRVWAWAQVWWLNPFVWTTAAGDVLSGQNYRC